VHADWLACADISAKESRLWIDGAKLEGKVEYVTCSKDQLPENNAWHNVFLAAAGAIHTTY